MLRSSGKISPESNSNLTDLLERLNKQPDDAPDASPETSESSDTVLPESTLPGAADDESVLGELVNDAIMADAGLVLPPVQGSGKPSDALPGSGGDEKVVGELVDDALSADSMVSATQVESIGVAPPAEPQASVESFPLTGDASLLAEFVSESREHLANATSELLACEQDPESQSMYM